MLLAWGLRSLCFVFGLLWRSDGGGGSWKGPREPREPWVSLFSSLLSSFPHLVS